MSIALPVLPQLFLEIRNIDTDEIHVVRPVFGAAFDFVLPLILLLFINHLEIRVDLSATGGGAGGFGRL